MLLGAGIDLNARGHGGKTPLIMSVDGNDDAFRHFLKAGADPNIMDDNGWNALHTATKGGREEQLELLLQTEGVDVNQRTQKGATPLHLATWSCWNDKTVRKLLENGADPNATAAQESTPLGGAIGSSSYPELKVVELLVKHGADVNAVTTIPQVEPECEDYRRGFGDDSDNEEEMEDSHNKGKKETPLLMAIKGKQEKIALFLLSKGADPGATNEKGESPLLQANELGLMNVVNCLFKMGVQDGSWNPMQK